jgi:hypothetical protein
MKGPVTPVCREGVPCDVPAAHVTLFFGRGGRIVARVQTTAKGTYRLALRPGRYSVSTARRIGFSLRPAAILVPRGRFRHVDFSIDTGIR